MVRSSAPDTGSGNLLAFAVSAFVALLAIAVLVALFLTPRSDPDIARDAVKSAKVMLTFDQEPA